MANTAAVVVMAAIWAGPPLALAGYSEELRPVTWTCVVRVSEEMGVPLALIAAIMATEDGQVGRVSWNKNGSRDIGPMQLNSWWLPLITQTGISEDELLRDGCVNVAAAGWILRDLMKKYQDPFSVIEAYHSLNPVHSSRYLRSVLKNALRLDVERVLLRANATVPEYSSLDKGEE